MARQHRIHLSPLQHAENNPGCACAPESVWLSVRGGGGSVVNTPMQNPDAVGQVSNNRARKANALCEEEADVI